MHAIHYRNADVHGQRLFYREAGSVTTWATESTQKYEYLVLARVPHAQDVADRAPALLARLLVTAAAQHGMGAVAGRRARQGRGLAEPLTSRERQVLGLLATGQANRGIADELVVSVDTVKRHVTHILAKLGAVNRTEAAARARELNLIP
jgi:DNA-binding NarL/FixJ family response regulator